MTGDRIVAVVAIIAMLILVVPRMGLGQMPARRMIKLVVIWATIFLGATAIVMLLGR